jgi:hypothetical protein
MQQTCGDLVGVATLGSAGASVDLTCWGDYLLPLRRILIAYDLDPAGETGAAKLANFTTRARRVDIPSLPGVKDITDFHKAGGSLRQWIMGELARLDQSESTKSINVDPEAELRRILETQPFDPVAWANAAARSGIGYNDGDLTLTGADGWRYWADES